jgi:hypothetical protein
LERRDDAKVAGNVQTFQSNSMVVWFEWWQGFSIIKERSEGLVQRRFGDEECTSLLDKLV